MLKGELCSSLVGHENVLKEEQKLSVDISGSKTSVLKLSNLEFATNLAISFRSCQSNREREFHAQLRWEVNKCIAREVCAIR